MGTQLFTFFPLIAIFVCMAQAKPHPHPHPQPVVLKFITDSNLALSINVSVEVKGKLLNGPFKLLPKDYYEIKVGDPKAVYKAKGTFMYFENYDPNREKKLGALFNAYDPARDNNKRVVYWLGGADGVSIRYGENQAWKLVSKWN